MCHFLLAQLHTFFYESCSFLGKATHSLHQHQDFNEQNHLCMTQRSYSEVGQIEKIKQGKTLLKYRKPTGKDMGLGGNGECMYSVVYCLILERVRILLWVCLWSFQTILIYTCMLKIVSPPFYCAVMLMDSCVTFYFHYNFCKEHEKLKCLSNL